MKVIYYRFINFLQTIRGNIAFYPTLFSIFGFSFSMLMLYLENKGISGIIIKHAPSLVINNADTAKTLLSFLTGGIISIMVFSFSMVMVLLNQASSNYSPRVLPGLISNRKHQFVLGIYLATILYNTFTLVGINPKPDDSYQLPGFSVLVGIMFTVVCFGAFLFFIHSISESIQINNILDGIFNKAYSRLDNLTEKEKDESLDFPDTDDWNAYYSSETGYFQSVVEGNLLTVCEEKDLQLQIIPLPGSFVLKGIPIFKVNKEIDEDLVKDILSNLNFSQGEFVENNYALGFKQITEIGIKAMSPGINDPGTAINTIDYLTELFSLRLQKKDRTIITRDDQAYINVNTVNFSDLLYQVLVTYRTYCKHDVTCVQKLMMMLRFLRLQPENSKKHTKAIIKETKSLFIDASDAINNENDIAVIKKIYDNIQKD